MKKTRFTLPALLAVTTVALAGCAGGGSGGATASTPSGDPVPGGELTLEFWPDNAAFTCVDPFQVYWIEHRQVIRNFADSLTDQDPETGEIVPWLATDWQISDDGLTYTFDLRDDVTFSDGSPFTADAVVTAFDNAKKTVDEVPGVYGGVYIAGYAASRAIDEHTVEIDFSEPNASFLQGTSTTNLAILSPASYDSTPEERCLGEGLIGSGPFVLDSYVPSESLDLSRREGYAWASGLNAHQGEAYLDAVHINYVAEDSVRVGNLASGASDIAWPRNPFTPEQIAQLEGAGATIESRSLPGPATNYYPNVAEGKVLSDPDVRTALQKAIDREEYAATIYGPDYPVVSSIYDTTTPYYVDHSADLAYDPEAAAEILDEAGWVLEDGAQFRTKNGEELTIVDPIQADNPGDALLQDQLKRVGINLELTVIQATDRPAIIASGDYDLLGNYYTRADPGVLQWIIDDRYAGSKALAQNTQSADVATEVKALFDAGRADIDPQTRGSHYAELQDLAIDQGVAFPIFERVQLAATGPNVHGFRFTSEAFLSYYDIWLSE